MSSSAANEKGKIILDDRPRDAMKCKHCGVDESAHCAFESAVDRPVGCNCEAGTWGDPMKIPAVCTGYRGDADSYCATCEHDQACHVDSREWSIR